MKFVERFILVHKKHLCSFILGCGYYNGQQIREICGEKKSKKFCEEKTDVAYIADCSFRHILNVADDLFSVPDNELLRCRRTRLDYAKTYKDWIKAGNDVLMTADVYGKYSYSGAKGLILNQKGVREYQFKRTKEDYDYFNSLMEPFRSKWDWTFAEFDELMGDNF